MNWQKNRHEGNGFSLQEEGGFTLIELLIVIIIIGILAAIAIPTFLAQRLKAQQAASKSDTRNAASAEVLYYADNDTFTTTIGVAGPPATGLYSEGFRQSDSVVTTVPTGNATTYCVQSTYGTVANTTFHMSETGGGVQAGTC